ncbi:MAG TPA: AMP-binding protein [Actinomycetota bacterium]|nr:AMP-binding protein [Actinomycetota bacterium]
MTHRSLAGLQQVGAFFAPSNMKRMRAAGAVSPKGPLGLLTALPWIVGRGPSLGIVSHLNSVVLGNKPAIHDRNGVTTFRELNRRAKKAANLFAAEGVKPGDSVALMTRNSREMAELLLGGQKSGVVICPLNTWAKKKELDATMASSKAKLIVYDTGHSKQVKSSATAGVPLLHIGDGAPADDRSRPYEKAIEAQSEAPPPPFTRQPGSARVIIHTSGTTGTPKGAARDSAAAGIGALSHILSVVPYHRDDVVLCSSPMFHSFGLATFTFATALGATLVLPEKFDPTETLRLIEQHKVTAASLVPVMIRRIIQLPDKVKSRYDVSSLRILMASGSVLSEDLRKETTALFGDVIYDLYGSTEVGWVAIATPQDIKDKPMTVGRAVEGTEVAVFDSKGRRVGPGETGELYIRSGVIFEGYTSGEKRAEIDGYMAIGDLGHIDDDGYIYVEARSDDMVVVGGENVYPIEVEQVIEGIEGVDEVTVFGVPDPEYVHVLVAVVVGNVTSQKVLKVCKQELASYKVPKRVEIADKLPRTSTGKVLKRELQASINHVR